jgi:hypothetical protein
VTEERGVGNEKNLFSPYLVLKISTQTRPYHHVSKPPT